MASEIERLIVTLEASTRQYERALARAQGTTVSAMRKIEGAIAQSETRQTALFSRMGAKASTAFTAGFKGLAGGIIGGLGIQQAVQAVGSAIKSVADLGDTAERLGISTQDLQVFNRIAVESGESAELMARGLSEVAEQSQDADSKLSKLFATFGTAPTGDVTRDMQTFMGILQRMQSPMQRAAALADVFGEKLGRRLAEALSQGPEKFIATLQEMTRQGEIFTDQQVKGAQDLEARWNTMTDRMATAFEKAIVDAMGSWGQFEETGVAAAKAIASAISDIIKIVQALMEMINTVREALSALGIDLSKVVSQDPWSDLRKLHLMPEIPNQYPGAQPGARAYGATQYFSKEFGQQIARGIVAGLQGESGANLNPEAVGDKGASIGIAQWQKDRRAELEKFAASFGKPVTDFATQLGFISKELATNKSHVADMLKGAKTAEEALAIWVREFEQPADPTGEIAKRRQYLMSGPAAPAGTAGALPAGYDLSKIAPVDTKTIEDRNAAMQEYADTLDRTALAASNVSAADQAMISAMATMPEQIQQVNDILANTTDQFAQDLLNGVDAAEALQNALKSLASQLLSMAIQRLFAFGGQQGGLFGALFGGMPGFQHGGSFTVGGKGGTDSNVVAFRATRGEHVTVTPPGHIAGNAQARPSIVFGGTSIVIQGNADERILARMRVMLAENNVRQRRELQRDIGTMNSRWNNMRGIAGSR